MDFLLLAKCVALGLAVAAPLGPIGTLCINRTLKSGLRAGLAGGLGTALGDAFYAAIAALGFTAFAAAIVTFETPLKLIGGLFMLWLGWKGLAAVPLGHPHAPSGACRVKNLAGIVLTTFLLTITNPMTVLFFAAMFASIGSLEGDAPCVVVAGIFGGSMLWWLILCGGVAVARQRLPECVIRRVSQGAGAVLIAVGLWALGSAAWAIV